jgi:hypothetical protein
MFKRNINVSVPAILPQKNKEENIPNSWSVNERSRLMSTIDVFIVLMSRQEKKERIKIRLNTNQRVLRGSSKEACFDSGRGFNSIRENL